MRNATVASLMAGWVLLLGVPSVSAQDWPQWRGPNRDGRATGFQAPKSWPKDLKQGWKVTVGDGVATPALVGDKLYVFSREQGNEVIRCLNTADGKEVWKDQYETGGVSRAASGFPGPRCSPAVADGKVIIQGVHGIVTCYDAVKGTKLWRKNDVRGEPGFSFSGSPLIVNGLCIAQLGSESDGVLIAYEMDSGKEKWKWSDSTAYASPTLLTVGDIKAIVAETSHNVAAINSADGTLLWKTPFRSAQMQYNAASPMAEGQTVIYGGTNRPIRAVKLDKKDKELAETKLWDNSDNTLQFNTPVLKEGQLYGISGRNNLFCIDMKSGKTGWSSSLGGAGGGGGGGGGRFGRGGYGSVVDAGSVMMALTPSGELVVFEPNAKEFKPLGKHKVGSTTYAYPIPSGKRIYVKDQNAVTVWTVE